MSSVYTIPRYASHAAAVNAAGFPSTVFTPFVLYDRTVGASPITETGTVPATPYQIQLPVPASTSGLTVTVGGTSRAVVATTPSSGQVRLDRTSGVFTFHSSDTGGSYSITETPLATAIMDQMFARVQGELAAVQTAVIGLAATTTNVLHVNKAGSDSTGNGTPGRPYLTIGAAIAAIGTPSETNLYVVDIGPGVYNEAVILTKSYVTIRGAGPDATVIRHDNPASASSGLYAGPLKIHSGTWGASHSGDTALAGVIIRDITLKNQPTVDDGDVYPALTIGDPTRALADSAITTPGAGIILENVHLRGYRDTLTICGRADILIRDSDIRGTLDTIFPIGANVTLINTRVENTTATANALIYACGTETVTLINCLLLCDSSGSTGAISIRTDPRDTSNVTLNISGTHVGTTGAPGTLRPLFLTINNSTNATINIGRGNTCTESGHRGTISGGTITWNFIGGDNPTITAGDRHTPGIIKARHASTGTTSPQVIIETLAASTTKQPQLITRYADIDGTTPSAINPTYTPVAVTSSGVILGEWLAQTYQNGAWNTSCRIRATQAATAGTGDTPGKWTFDTSADGDSTLVTRFTINADGTCVAAVSLEAPLFKFPADSTFVTTLTHTTATANRTITLPDASGTVAVSATAPITLSAAGAIAIPAATGSVNGYLTSTDWTTFNNKGVGTVTAVSVATANGVSGSSSGGATPALTLTLGAITPSSVASAGPVSGTTVTASAQVGCEVYHSTTQTITAATDTAILFDSEDSDVGTCHDTGTNTSRLTATVAGTYLVTATVGTAQDISGDIIRAWVAKNGAILSSSPRYAQAIHDHSGSSGGGAWFNLSYVITLAANDYLEIYINADIGSDYGSATVSLRNRASFKRLY